MFYRRCFLDLVRHFVVFESDGTVTAKKLAGYHQFHAGRKAVEATVRNSRPHDEFDYFRWDRLERMLETLG